MMGRKSGAASGSKPPASKQGKPGENVKGPKRKPAPTASSVGLKKKQVKSKPGFTLYSGSSKVEGGQGVGPEGAKPESLSKSASKEKHASKGEKVAEAASEIVSQVQLQEERAKATNMSSFYIPTADPEDSVSDDFTVSTPFNKRLVSSTPDPERLREVDAEEENKNLLPASVASAARIPLQDSPQMIPERDVVMTGAHPIPPDPTALTPSVVKGLAEKLRLQREAAHSSKSSVSPANPSKPVPPWKQKHQKWKQELQQYKKDETEDQITSEGREKGILNSIVVPETNTDQSSQFFMTKAEWISDSVTSDRVKKDSSNLSDEGPKRKHSNEQQGLIEVSKTTADSRIPSSDISTPAVSVVKTNISNSEARGASSVWTMPTPLSSFQSKAALPTVYNHVKHYENFKSGILQNMNNSSNGMKSSPRSHVPSEQGIICTQSERLHPISAPTVTARSNMATNTSTLTHTATVSSLSSLLKVCETVSGPGSHSQKPALFLPETDAALIPKFDVIQGNQIVFDAAENTAENGENKKYRYEGNPLNYLKSAAINIPTAAALDSTASSQDSLQDRLNISSEKHRSQNQERKDIASDGNHNTSYLSEVINFLKTDGFNAKETTNQPETFSSSEEEGKTKAEQALQAENKVVPNPADDNLRAIMSQYLPQGETNPDKQPVENSNTDSVHSTEKATLAQQNLNNSSSAEVNKGDSNQNYNSDDSYERPRRRRRSRNLYYLENMADPTLRDIACRLAFKATALRDIELRDLIDDMIFHTDAALGHEDARYQSSNLFLQEENSKLKKRLHNVNRQLDAKERQEKMAATSVYSVSNNEMLHMERKMMHLRQEKDRLDAQLTTLLEEKSRWLVTQQDLVRTISLKDHEILKLEEKHQQERIKLHQNLDQATQNSQGVHYKLSVADREISNMEQRLKCRDLDIADLREKLRLSELKTGECQQQVTAKDLEISRLKDMVDTLKLGVDHVLQMFEGGVARLATTDQQRQGIDSLYRMAHPERFATSSERTPSSYHPLPPPRGEIGSQTGVLAAPPRIGQVPGTSSQTSDHLAHPPPVRPEPRYADRPQKGESKTSREEDESYPRQIMSWVQNRLLNLGGQTQGERSRHRQQSRENELDNRLTASTLERHNERLSPIDRRLWRSMHESPIEFADEPYYSDSELELNQRESRRQSSKRGPKSILKRGRGKEAQTFWQTSTPTREVYDDEQDDGRGREPYRISELDRRRRTRRKSESDKYTDHRGSRRSLQKLPGDRSKRVRSTTPRESCRESSSRQDELDFESDESVAEYFKKKSQMPRLPKSPQRTSRYGKLPGSHSSKQSTLYSVPISNSTDSRGRRTQDNSSRSQRSKSWTGDDELVEIDIESSSADSNELQARRSESSASARQQRRDASRSYSPSSIRKTHKSKKSDRRSRSLEDRPPSGRDLDFGRSTGSTFQEQETRLRTLEPDDGSSWVPCSSHQRRNRSKSYTSSRTGSSSTRSRQEEGSPSRKGPPQQYNGQSSGGTTNGIPSHYATRGSDFPNQTERRLRLSDISVSRRATKGGDSTQREFFQGTELSNSTLSSIEDFNDGNNGALGESTNNNQMRSINEDLFSTGIASLDMKIANLQKKIDRAKAIFS